MSQSRSVSSMRKKRMSSKNRFNQYVLAYISALQENMGSIPKIFLDGERFFCDTTPEAEAEPNQTQVHFFTANDGSPKCIKYRLNFLTDESMIALQSQIPMYTNLTELRLEFCSLTYDQLLFVHMILQEHPQIAHLSLNGNPKQSPTDDEGHHLPVHGTSLKILSVALCNLGARSAAEFCNALSKPDRITKTLVSLNMGCNNIGDDGCEQIANMLRSNRLLQALNISDNKISEKSLINLMDVFTKFRLSAAEVRYKRQIKLLSIIREYFPLIKGKDMSAPSTSSKSSTTTTSTAEAETNVYANHPFSNDIVTEEGELFCNGNNNLLHLNISYNAITSNVLEKIIEVVRYQKSNLRLGGLQRVLVESRKQYPDLIQEMNQALYNTPNRLSSKQIRPSSIA